MSAATKILILILLLSVAVVAITASFIHVSQAGIKLTQYTNNVGEITNDVLIGQTFIAAKNNLSGVAVQFATYSGRDNKVTIQFHLRESLTSKDDLRFMEISAKDLRDNQLYKFSFDKIPKSKGHTYFFYITSVDASPGNAVTIDINTTDPYHLGSAYIVRNASKVDNFAIGGKQTIDLSFVDYYQVSLHSAIVTNSKIAFNTFVGTWAEKKSSYALWAKLFMPVLVFFLLLLLLQVNTRKKVISFLTSKKGVTILLILLMILAVAWRVFYATTMPITNDEGNYLYDAQVLREGILAGGDGYVKSPLMILWVSLWQLIIGNSILAARMSSVVIGVLTLIPIYFIGREFHSKQTGLLSAAIWALFGSLSVFGIYVHTQPVALFFGISAIALLLTGLRQDEDENSLKRFLLVGVLLGLGVASRKSVLALGLIPLISILFESRSWSRKIKRLIVLGIGFMLVISLLFGVAYWLYGMEGIREVAGVNSAVDGMSAVDPAEIDQVRAYSLRGMTPFFRESLPLILLSVLGWGIIFESAVRKSLRLLLKRRPGKYVLFLFEDMIPKLAWVFPGLAFWWAFSFFFEYEGSVFIQFGNMGALWVIFIGVIVVIALWAKDRKEKYVFSDSKKTAVAKSSQPKLLNVVGYVAEKSGQKKESTEDKEFQKSLFNDWSTVLIAPLWFGGLVFFYVNWIKFHANYIGEFLPPLVILSGVGVYLAWKRLQGTVSFARSHPLLTIVRWVVLAIFSVVLVWSIYLSNYITYMYEHTGTFDQRAAREAAAWAKENIPMDQTIFTGAALIPYLSGHHTALNIAHPRWYAYEFTRKNPKRLNTFLPPAEDMVQAFRDAQWVLLEKQTGFSFLMEYSEIEAGLEKYFESIHGIENGSNTLTFYKRIR